MRWLLKKALHRAKPLQHRLPKRTQAQLRLNKTHLWTILSSEGIASFLFVPAVLKTDPQISYQQKHHT
jgi:hypothetical protein